MRWSSRNRLALLGMVSLAIALMGAACGGNGTNGGTARATATATVVGNILKVAYDGWDTNDIPAAVTTYIVENGYDFQTRKVDVTSTQQMQDGFDTGFFHIYFELRRENYEDWWAAQRRRKVVDRGVSYKDSVQGWYVPAYVEGVASIEDVGSNPAAVGGRFISCPKGFACDEINKIKLQAYGLADSLTVENPTSYTALHATLEQAYDSQEPFVTYYRDPSWLLMSKEWVRLEEPAHDALCWARIRQVQQGTKGISELENACAYPKAAVLIAASRHLGAVSEPLMTFFFEMTFGKDIVEELVKYKHENNASNEDTALYYLRNNEGQWTQWVPADVANKVKATLGG